MAKKKAAAKKAPAKAAKKGKGGAGNAAFMAPKTPSAALAAVTGATPLPRSGVVKKLWAYIHKHGLQDKENKRQINNDETFKGIFGKSSMTMFEMNKLLGKHLS